MCKNSFFPVVLKIESSDGKTAKKYEAGRLERKQEERFGSGISGEVGIVGLK